MSKAVRNRQAAREKIARIQAAQAHRRRRRHWIAGVGTAAAIIAVAAVTLAVTSAGGGPAAGGGQPKLRLAAVSTLGTLAPPPSPGSPGPEGVPVPAAAPLASTATAATGRTVDGVSCQKSEGSLFHIHAHLTVIVNGSLRQVPAEIGIPGSCLYWLHTHASDGVIHIESPVRRVFTLGQVFDEWGQPLSQNRIGPALGHVTALYNGKVYLGNPRDIPLKAHSEIQLEVGTPLVAPETFAFPNGL